MRSDLRSNVSNASNAINDSRASNVSDVSDVFAKLQGPPVPLTSVDLQTLLDYYGIPATAYRQLPRSSPPPGRGGILNWDYKSGGTHWYAFYVTPDVTYVYDPLGFPPDKEACKLFPKIHMELGSQTPDPNDGDDWCGLYCVEWLRTKTR